MRYIIGVAALLGMAVVGLGQEGAAPKAGKRPMIAAAPPAVAKGVAGYEAVVVAGDIAPTVVTANFGKVEVEGEPRMTTGHPCTLWDAQDINQMKDLLKTNQIAQEEYAKLKEKMDERIGQPMDVPEPKKGEDGEWMYPGDMPEYKGKQVNTIHRDNAAAITDLGTIYALSGDAKYGEYCKKLLLGYARGFTKWGHPLFKGEKWTDRAHRSENDGRLSGQFLEDGFWLIQAARGYDLVHDLPGWTDEERKEVREDLFEAITDEFVDDVLGPQAYINQTHNRSVICNAGVLMAGYASDDEKLINYGLYGKGGTKDKPLGGVFGKHFTTQCISPDGMWNEGAMGYQNMALVALVDDAQTLWHHGIDMYRYDHGILKHLFDAEILFTYPDLTFPATHDSARSSIIPTEKWNDDGPRAFEYGYLRYRDPRYLAPVTRLHLSLRQSVHFGPTSVLFDQDLNHKPAITNSQSVNFTDNGYGILRLGGESPVNLLMQYGQSRSHGHPDKLSIDLYAQGDVVIPDPGVIFPYNAPLDKTWYWTTAGHATLTVDQKSQMYAANRYLFPRNIPEPGAVQLVFGPAETMGVERAWSNTVYPGVVQDRALFVTGDYVADLFGAFSGESHTYDLSWHVRGDLKPELALSPMTLPEPVEDGYDALGPITHAVTKDGWKMTTTKGERVVGLVAAGGAETDVMVGEGYYRLNNKDEKVPAIYERRTGAQTVFGNAVDISGSKEGYVKSVSEEGGLDAGYGLLKVTTVKGVDLCFASYRPGSYKAGGLETDAQQGFVTMDGDSVRSMYLGGGKVLKAAGGTLERSEQGLAYLEKTKAGSYVVGNPSAAAATVTVNFPALAGLQAYLVDESGKRGGVAPTAAGAGGGVMLELKGGQKVEFAAK